jgi:tRNA (uracil-5-)-methyltransferase
MNHHQEVGEVSSAPLAKIISGTLPFELSYLNYDPADYTSQLRRKSALVEELLASLPNSAGHGVHFDIFPSPAVNYRYRCRFAVIHGEDGCVSSYALFEHGRPEVVVVEYPLASREICMIMQPLLREINASVDMRAGLEAVSFLSTTKREMVVALIYSCSLPHTWEAEAHLIVNTLRRSFREELREIHLIGQSKGVRCVIGSETIQEEFLLKDGRTIKYFQTLSGFSNPNAIVNADCLSWISDSVRLICADRSKSVDSLFGDCTYAMNLLELYCGNGNHTCAIAGSSLCGFFYLQLLLYAMICCRKHPVACCS